MKSTGGREENLRWISNMDTVASMRGHPMLCFMCPTVTGVGVGYIGI